MVYLSDPSEAIRRKCDELGLSPAEAARRIGITNEELVKKFLAGAPLEGVTVMLGRSESEFNINVDLQPDGDGSEQTSDETFCWMAVDDWVGCMAHHVAGSF